MEQLGFWELIHGASAGCVSIAAFESMREVLHGGLLLATYTAATIALFKFHHWHLQRLKARRAPKL